MLPLRRHGKQDFIIISARQADFLPCRPQCACCGRERNLIGLYAHMQSVFPRQMASILYQPVGHIHSGGCQTMQGQPYPWLRQAVAFRQMLRGVSQRRFYPLPHTQAQRSIPYGPTHPQSIPRPRTTSLARLTGQDRANTGQ